MLCCVGLVRFVLFCVDVCCVVVICFKFDFHVCLLFCLLFQMPLWWFDLFLLFVCLCVWLFVLLCVRLLCFVVCVVSFCFVLLVYCFILRVMIVCYSMSVSNARVLCCLFVCVVGYVFALGCCLCVVLCLWCVFVWFVLWCFVLLYSLDLLFPCVFGIMYIVQML